MENNNHGLDKDFLEEQLDLLDARISKIDRKLGDIGNSLKMLHDKLLQRPSNVVDINKNSSYKNNGTQIEALRRELDEAIQTNVERGLPANCGAVPNLRNAIANLEDPNYKPTSVKKKENLRTQKQQEMQGLYNQVQALAINESFSFPVSKSERVRRSVRKFNEIYGTHYEIIIRRNWSDLNLVHIIRIR
tara:strand:- start:33 stop:602 length:570 start_codon:yes stop_codon:yes gene_type:complete